MDPDDGTEEGYEMISPLVNNLRFRWFLAALAVCPVLPVRVLAQCSSSSPPPGLNGQSWNDSGTRNVYVDPTLPADIQDQVIQAAAAFGAQTGQPINVLPANAADPGTATQNTIHFINNPSGSPNSFAHTDTLDVYQNGVDTHKK